MTQPQQNQNPMKPTEINKLKVKLRAAVLAAGETPEFFNALLYGAGSLRCHGCKCKATPPCKQCQGLLNHATSLEDRIAKIVGVHLSTALFELPDSMEATL